MTARRPFTKRLLPTEVRRPLLLLGFCLLLTMGGFELINHFEMLVDLKSLAHRAMQDRATLVVLLAIYVLLLACPFVPGAELGLMLLATFGADVALLVYLAAVTALVLSFWIGRLIPGPVLYKLFMSLRLTRAAELLKAQQDGPSHNLTEKPRGFMANRWLQWLFRYRCLTLIVLINTPGNTIIGGGGGIAMVAGISRLIPFREFLVAVLVALAPVPLIFIVTSWLT